MIAVVAVIQVAPGRKDELLEALATVVPAVRAEPGCVEYAAWLDAPPEFGFTGPTRPDTVTILEKWESADALHAHLASPHMQAYREATAKIVVDKQIHFFHPA